MKLLELKPAPLQYVVGERDRQSDLDCGPNKSVAEHVVAIDSECTAVALVREAQQNFVRRLGARRAR